MRFVAAAIILFTWTTAALASEVRIKDLVEFDGVRGNGLVGYGLVVGLNGTGDGIRNAPFTDFAVQLATFSGVEQQVRTNQLLESLAAGIGMSGISQLAGWVGMEVRVAAPAAFDGTPVTLVPSPDPASDAATLVVRDAFDRVVSREAVPLEVDTIQWAGVGDDGAPLPPGLYSFQLESLNGGEVTSTRPVEHYAMVTEARQGANGIEVVVRGGTAVLSADVTALRRPPDGG